jgi:hypothetical protein
MSGRWTHGLAAALLTAAVAAVAVGCSDDNNPSGTASSAASAAPSQLPSAASSLASQASEALASASAEVGRRLSEVKNGVDAKDDVKLGKVTTDSDGHAVVTVTARNTADSAKSFAVQISYQDKSGNLLDMVVTTVKNVAAGKSANATARSNRKLSGDVRAKVGIAVRY